MPATLSGTARAGATAAPTPAIYWGAWIDGSQFGLSNPPWDMRAVATFESQAGKRLSILHFGQAWAQGGVMQPFRARLFRAIRRHGSIPLVDWNSWDVAADGAPTQPEFTLSRIIDGSYDGYIRAWAEGARAWGKPFFLRLDHEMNGTWFPWVESQNGNAPGQFVIAWRHIHDVFESVGAHNVTWVWSPNIKFRGSPALAGLYPGADYVDWVAMDGYNFGTNPVKSDVWRPFRALIRGTYGVLRTLAPGKPMMIAETASSEFGGSKAAWIASAFASLPKDFPLVKAIVWFDWDADGEDWSITSSPAATEAFREAIASPYFAPNRYGGLATSPIGAPA